MSAHHASRGMLAAVAVLSTMLLSTPAHADTVTQWTRDHDHNHDHNLRGVSS